MEFQRSSSNIREVSLIPLINVIFLLLIFFMVAGTVEGIDIFEVDLPEAKSGRNKPYIPAVIYLGADGRLAVNNDIVAPKDFKTIVSTLFIDNPNQKVTIKADSLVPAQRLVKVMNVIEKAGGKEVSIVTRAKE